VLCFCTANNKRLACLHGLKPDSGNRSQGSVTPRNPNQLQSCLLTKRHAVLPQ
jgi:hypothetical protein